ncbi:TetR/AcrR family transcriptional regulator [Tsukamurella soli]
MAELMRHQGYSATSVKQLTAAASAPMGSLYHHFPEGKVQVAAAALRDSGAAYIELLPLLMDPHADLAAAVTGAFDAAADRIEETGWLNMCPVGTIAGEIAESEPDLRAVAAEVMTLWIERGTTYFIARGLAPDAARELTLALLSALEGAFILSRTLRTAEPVRAAGRALAARAAALAVT